MIKERDVIRMKVPFPSITSGLAVTPHMYICTKESIPTYEFVKCQTLKPYLIKRSVINHYIDEPADLSRNPFSHLSRIDCDKVFSTSCVRYDDKLKTISRPDICEELHSEIKKKLADNGPQTVLLNEDELTNLNPLITKISPSA